ncbi:hypothetical protein HU200_038445 [Digitaria exilis]|uniref:Uncharacterized protein n=1 Tax=Digitaria exilis TaxID=1010633 RepID=A0A835EIH9_9POAL|nr:hypothetical protein HU200_038445 [Digitaria exilis]
MQHTMRDGEKVDGGMSYEMARVTWCLMAEED